MRCFPVPTQLFDSTRIVFVKSLCMPFCNCYVILRHKFANITTQNLDSECNIYICLLLRPSLRHGKVTISRGPAESCKMNKCCFEPASLKKAVLFVQRWYGQQTLSLENASFHILRVAILIYKFHAAFLYPVYIQDYVQIYLLT